MGHVLKERKKELVGTAELRDILVALDDEILYHIMDDHVIVV